MLSHPIKYLFLFLLLLNCKNSKPTIDISKTFTYDVTFQNWISEDGKVKGLDLLIPIKYNPYNIKLDSVYFMNMSTNLKEWYSKQSKIKYYVGRFQTYPRSHIDSSETAIHYFKKIKENECIVTYNTDSIKQFKILRGINDVSHLPFYLSRD